VKHRSILLFFTILLLGYPTFLFAEAGDTIPSIYRPINNISSGLNKPQTGFGYGNNVGVTEFELPSSGAQQAAGAGKSVAEEGKMKASISKLRFLVPKDCMVDYVTANEAIKACADGGNRASMMCLEHLSPALQELIPNLGLIASAIGVVTGTKEKCEKANQGMRLAQGALAAYNVACAGGMMACKSACGKAKASLQKVNAEATAYGTAKPTSKAACSELVTQTETISASIVEVTGSCTGYSVNLVAAAAAAAQVIMDVAKSKECADQTSAAEVSICATNPNDPSCVNCTDPKFASNPICICAASPRSPGCESQSNLPITAPVLNEGSDGSGAGDLVGGGSDGSGVQSFAGGEGSSGGPSSAGLAGGAGGGGSSGADGSGKAKGDGADNSKKLNTNILSDSGGGGGGGRQGFGHLGKYAEMLPQNQALLNQRGLASAQNGKDQITTSNGLSNWQKVKNRYQESKTLLMSP